MNGANEQNGLLPPAELLDWFQVRKDLLPQNVLISGQSLKYFRNDLPVAVAAVDRVGLEALQVAFPREEGGLAEVKEVRHARGEVKLVLDFTPGTEYHLLFRETDWLEQGAALSLDRLWLAPGEQDWQGSAADLADLLAGRLRLSRPDAAEARDAFRMGAFASMTDWDPEPETMDRLAESMRAGAPVDGEKNFLRKQFQKIVLGRRPSRGFEVLREIGALDALLPELSAGLGLEQNRYHRHDIYYHSIYACDAAEQDLILRLSALFHDLGKVDTRKVHENGEASFHNHEIVSTRHTENIMRRLGFPGPLKKRVKFLVRNHMFHYTDAWSDRAIRRFMKRVSTDQLEELIALRLADRKGSGKRSELPRAIKTLMRHIQEVRARDAEIKVKDLAIDGHLLQELGMPPGPEMGRLLNELLEEVKAGRLPNEGEPLELEARRRLDLQPAAAAVSS